MQSLTAEVEKFRDGKTLFTLYVYLFLHKNIIVILTMVYS